MVRVVSCLILLIGFSVSHAQIRLEKLSIEKNEKYLIQASDILVVDTLIMADSSQIILNHDKKDNFIHAKIWVVGVNCSINGSGAKGKDGEKGVDGAEMLSPCRQGGIGQDGSVGLSGKAGNSLFIYSDDIQINGSLTINLNGGDGGDGGDGGQGGGGGPGTRVCAGGDGGQGGNGSRGGNGGNGGNLTITCKRCPDLQVWLGGRLQVKNYGGFGGLGGEAGRGGLTGLGPVRDGKNGIRGYHGEEGETGKNGAIAFNKK
ncbi:MAG: hypothetical protein JNL53_05055 [Cyclobacteriaceae bacterium]|nr:hypothetical protein [Cyclobacteriaceae bacterium]